MSAITMDRVSGPAKPNPEISDEILVERLREGVSAAGESLVRRHTEALLRYLYRLTGSQFHAEELHQQTWMSVLDHLDKFHPGPEGGGFKSWLYRIATNKANDLWRSNGRERATREGMRLVVDNEVPHAGYRLEGSEQEQKLRRAIDQLPENQKQVLLLRYYSGMKFTEIAETVGCPLNTALGRMHKAMQKLKQLME